MLREKQTYLLGSTIQESIGITQQMTEVNYFEDIKSNY